MERHTCPPDRRSKDNPVALIRFESGALGQFEVSWTFRGGLDLRDEIAGTEGTIWLNHFLRTGFEMYTSGSGDRYVAEKIESTEGWIFAVGDEVSEFGYANMFTDMFDAMDQGREPRETFYDGYIVNAVMDAAYHSARRYATVGTGRYRVAGRDHGSDREESRHARRPFDHQRDPSRRPGEAHAVQQGDRGDLRSCSPTRSELGRQTSVSEVPATSVSGNG